MGFGAMLADENKLIFFVRYQQQSGLDFYY